LKNFEKFLPCWRLKSKSFQIERLNFDAIDYIINCYNKIDGGFGDYPSEQQSYVNATAKGLICLNLFNKLELVKKVDVYSFLKGCQNSDGGFGITTTKNDFFPSNFESTYYAILALNLISCLPRLKLKLPKITNWLISHYNTDGGFHGDDTVISNEYYTLLAIKILIILKKIDILNQNLTINYLISEQTKRNPEVIFTTSRLLGLLILKSLEKLNLKISISRLARCQNKDGGYRKKKIAIIYKSDIHSTYQAILGLNIIDKQERIKKEKVINWIISCQNENGGFGKDPSSKPSLSNTFYALLSLYYLKSF